MRISEWVDQKKAQAEILDKYFGAARGAPCVCDATTVCEKLRYNSLVAVNPGDYEVERFDPSETNSTVAKPCTPSHSAGNDATCNRNQALVFSLEN